LTGLKKFIVVDGLRLTIISLTWALDEGWRSTPLSLTALPPVKRPGTIVEGTEWAPGPVWTGAETDFPEPHSCVVTYSTDLLHQICWTS